MISLVAILYFVYPAYINLALCRLGSKSACTFASWAVNLPKNENTTSLRAAYSLACTGKDPHVCVASALLKLRAGDVPAAREILSETCEKDRIWGSGCNLLAEVYRREANQEQFEYYSEMACSHGDSVGCKVGQEKAANAEFVRFALFRHKIVCSPQTRCPRITPKPDVSWATSTLSKLCNLRDAKSCGRLSSFLHARTTPVAYDQNFLINHDKPKKVKAIRGLSRKACEFGDLDYCMFAGDEAIEDGNQSEGLRLFQQGCNQENTASCRALIGFLSQHDRKKEAEEVFRRHCLTGHPGKQCSWLKSFYFSK